MNAKPLCFPALCLVLALPASALPSRINLTDASPSLQLRLDSQLTHAPLPQGKLHPAIAAVDEVADASEPREPTEPASAYWAFALGLGIGIFLTLVLFAPALSFGRQKPDFL